jgi:hypothetical protein
MTRTTHISDPSMLEAAYSQIAKWPAPTVGHLELPFMGSVIALEMLVTHSKWFCFLCLLIPSAPHPAFPLQGLSNPSSSISNGPSPATYAYQPHGSWGSFLRLMPSLIDLYAVYENALLCESIIVVADSPQICSEFVSLVVDMIRPVPYSGTCRPYMTMQSNFRCIGLDGGTPQPFIIGITNPFLLKRIMDSPQVAGKGQPIVIYLQSNSEQVPIKRHHSQHRQVPAGFSLPGGVDAYPPKKSYMKSDHAFLQELDSVTTIEPVSHKSHMDVLVRRHFAELTAQFLSPIIRYLATSVSADPTAPAYNPEYANFSQSGFLQSLSKHGTAIKVKGQGPLQKHKTRDAFYKRFCDSPNWHSWIHMKTGLEKEASAGLLG